MSKGKIDWTKWHIDDTENLIHRKIRRLKDRKIPPKTLKRMHRDLITKGETDYIPEELGL